MFKPVDDLLRVSLGRVYTAVSAEIRKHGQVVFRASYGTIDPDGNLENISAPVRADTLFDFASLTKLFTTTTFLRLVDAGKVRLDTSVGAVLPEFNGTRPIRPYPNPLNISEQIAVVPPTDELVDAGKVTFEHLLTHSSGLPAWLNLREKETESERITMCLTTPFACPIGLRVIYSDVGFILTGKAIEQLTGKRLDAAVRELVIDPLGVSARYGPIAENVAPTELDPWRGRRIIGEVHDENSATLGGIAGHAGLFGTAADVAAVGQLYLDSGRNLISAELTANATRRHIEDRGLGWMLRSEGSSSGNYFSDASFGHTGFVGNSLWVDPTRGLVCALLTNNVFFGRDKEQIINFRRTFHDTVIQALEGTGVPH